MYHIIANQTSLEGKNKKKAQIVKEVFDRAGREYTFHFTEYAGHGKEIAQSLCETEEDFDLIAMGGDGTLHEVVNGITDFKKCRLGLIPIGTGNDFAESVGLSAKDTKYAAEVIAFKAARPIDYIQLSSGLRSINAFGFGIDVDVLKRTYAGKRRSRSKYLFSLIAALFHFQSYGFTVKFEGKEEHHEGLIAALGNGRQIGGGIKLFPNAEVNDGLMDLIVVDFLSKPKIIPAFIKLMSGKLSDTPEIHTYRVKEATFIPDDEHYTFQAEGELYQDQPMEAKLVSDELKFYLP